MQIRTFLNRTEYSLTKRFLAVMVVLFLLLAWALQTQAAFNSQINYQGKLTTAAGVAVTDATYSIVFSLYTVSSGGSNIWTETQNVTVEDGLFSVMLGSDTVLTGVDFDQTLYLGVNVEADGEMSPRKVLGAVPAAFVADTVDGVDSTSFVRSDEADTIAVTDNSNAALTITQSGTGDILNLFDGGSEVLTVLDGGNVGIGTASPGALLQVGDGNDVVYNQDLVYFANQGTDDILSLRTTGNNQWAFRASGDGGSSFNSIINMSVARTTFNDDSTNDYIFRVEGATDANLLYVDGTDDRVGIGTSSPSGKLSIVASTNSSATPPISITNNASDNFVPGFVSLAPNLSAGQANFFTFGRALSSNNAGSLVYTYAGSGSTSNRLGLNFYGGSELLSILAGGNVGIGTTSPSNLLDVSQSINGATTALVTNTNSGTSAIARIGATNGTGNIFLNATGTSHSAAAAFPANAGVIQTNSSMAGGLNFLAAHSSAPIRFYSGGSDAANLAMVINTSQQVGIGTSSPDQILDVVQNANQNTYISVTNTDSGIAAHAAFRQVAETAALYQIAHSDARTVERSGVTLGGWNEILALTGSGLLINTNNATPVVFGTNDTEAMRIDSDGNVGIGTTSPAEELHVYGASGGTRIYVENDGTTGSDSANLRLDKGGASAFSNVSYLTAGTVNWHTGTLGNNNFTIANGTVSLTPFVIETSTPSNTLYLDSTGNVGIGETSPSYKFDITIPDDTGLASGAGVRVSNSDGSFLLGNGTGTANSFQPTFRGISNGSTRSGLLFQGHIPVVDDTGTTAVVNFTAEQEDFTAITTRPLFDFTNSGTSVMLIDVDGNVGIGTTDPGYLLDVQGTGVVTNYQRNTSDTDALRAIANFRHTTDQASISDGFGAVFNFEVEDAGGSNAMAQMGAYRSGGTDNAGTFTIRTSNTSDTIVDALVIDHDQNVGIGITSPGSKLTVFEDRASQSTGDPQVLMEGDYAFQWLKSNTGDAHLLVSGDSSKAGALHTGGLGMFFEYDETGVFGVRSSPRANLESGTFGDTTDGTGLKLQNDNQFGIGGGGVGTADSYGAFSLYGDTSQNVYVPNGEAYFTGGSVGVGTTDPSYLLDITSSASAQIRSIATNTSTTTGGSFLVLGNNDGAAMADGHRLGGLFFQAAEDASNNLASGAGITADATELWDASGHGTRLEFIIVPENSTTLTTAMTLDSDGALYLGGAGTANPLVMTAGSGQSAVITAEATDATRYSGMNILDSTSTLAASFAYGNPSAAAFTDEFVFATRQSDIDMVFYQGGATASDEQMRLTPTELVINEQSVDLDFRVESNGNANMLFVDGGNDRVGIGTAAPSAQFHVLGSSAGIFLERTGGSEPFVLVYDGNFSHGGQIRGRTDVSGFNFTDAGDTTDYMSVTAGGIGIGQTSPQTNLHVSESNTSVLPGVEIEQLSTGDAGLQFSISGDAYALGIDNSDSDKFKISYAAGEGTAVLGTNDRLVIDASGDVGIGTTSPSLKLDVNGGIELGDSGSQQFQFVNTNGRLNIQSQSSASAGSMWFFTKDGDGTDNIAITVFAQGTPDNITNFEGLATGFIASTNTYEISSTAAGSGTVHPIKLYTGANTSQLYLDTDGDVGIGTTSPTVRLDVKSPGTSSSVLQVTESSSTDAIFRVYEGSLGAGNIYLQDGSSTDSVRISGGTSDTYFDGSGNFGIGETTPDAKLHVTIGSDGSPVRFEDTDGYCEINPTTTTWSCTSDESLKTNITSIDSVSSFESILALRPVEFEWKTNRGKARQGLIAQEVEEIFPELVITNDDGLKSVAYGGLTIHLISAVQELNEKIDTQLAAMGVAPESAIESIVHFAELVVDRLRVKTIEVEEGIQIKDQETGEIYCVVVRGGELVHEEGECGSQNSTDEDDVDTGNSSGGTVVEVGQAVDDEGNIIDPATGEEVDEEGGSTEAEQEDPASEETPESETDATDEAEDPVEEGAEPTEETESEAVDESVSEDEDPEEEPASDENSAEELAAEGDSAE